MAEKRVKRSLKTKERKGKELLERVNVPKLICLHLIGEKHTAHHRMSVGLIIMGVGVAICKMTSSFYIISYIGEGIGYLIHGIGTIPFVEHLQTYLVAPASQQVEEEQEA